MKKISVLLTIFSMFFIQFQPNLSVKSKSISIDKISFGLNEANAFLGRKGRKRRRGRREIRSERREGRREARKTKRSQLKECRNLSGAEKRSCKKGARKAFRNSKREGRRNARYKKVQKGVAVGGKAFKHCVRKAGDNKQAVDKCFKKRNIRAAVSIHPVGAAAMAIGSRDKRAYRKDRREACSHLRGRDKRKCKRNYNKEARDSF